MHRNRCAFSAADIYIMVAALALAVYTAGIQYAPAASPQVRPSTIQVTPASLRLIAPSLVQTTPGTIVEGTIVDDAPAGERGVGTSIRFWDDHSAAWRVVWVYPVTGVLIALSGGAVGGSSHLPHQYAERIAFVAKLRVGDR
jgi:hypothetical protein